MRLQAVVGMLDSSRPVRITRSIASRFERTPLTGDALNERQMQLAYRRSLELSMSAMPGSSGGGSAEAAGDEDDLFVEFSEDTALHQNIVQAYGARTLSLPLGRSAFALRTRPARLIPESFVHRKFAVLNPSGIAPAPRFVRVESILCIHHLHVRLGFSDLKAAVEFEYSFTIRSEHCWVAS